MIATSHVIIGGTVGVIVGHYTQSPLAALVSGFASHLVCDTIPHLDHPPAPRKNEELIWTKAVWIFAIGDSLLAGLITMFFWYSFYSFPLISSFIAGAVGGYLPDFIDNVPFWKNIVRRWPVFKQFHNFHEYVHHLWGKKYPMPQYWKLGVLTQIIVVGYCLWYLTP